MRLVHLPQGHGWGERFWSDILGWLTWKASSLNSLPHICKKLLCKEKITSRERQRPNLPRFGKITWCVCISRMHKIVQMTAQGTPFSWCISMALCDLRYVAPQKNICLLIYKRSGECYWMAHRSDRPKRQCTSADTDTCHKAVKRCDQKDVHTYSIPKEVSSLRRAGPYLIG